ncbi:MAG: sodium:proton antiporter, partial [Microbacterium sp.]|nr:sodium:proton antiporter [Microbacterium sp.]
VAYGHAALITALATVSLLLLCVVAFVFDVVVDAGASLTVAAVLATLILVLWVVVPLVMRRGARTGGATP